LSYRVAAEIDPALSSRCHFKKNESQKTTAVFGATRAFQAANGHSSAQVSSTNATMRRDENNSG
jgi:hypothetical protein